MELTNVEKILLEIIYEKDNLNSYEIKKIVEERGYKNWANIGKTSIYEGIKRLANKKEIIIKQKKDLGKRGPISNGLRITEKGIKEIHKEIINSLLSERDISTYYIGLAGMYLVDKREIIKTLILRRDKEIKKIKQLKQIFEEKKKQGLPLPGIVLFDYSLRMLDLDIKFIDMLLTKLK